MTLDIFNNSTDLMAQWCEFWDDEKVQYNSTSKYISIYPGTDHQEYIKCVAAMPDNFSFLHEDIQKIARHKKCGWVNVIDCPPGGEVKALQVTAMFENPVELVKQDVWRFRPPVVKHNLDDCLVKSQSLYTKNLEAWKEYLEKQWITCREVNGFLVLDAAKQVVCLVNAIPRNRGGVVDELTMQGFPDIPNFKLIKGLQKQNFNLVYVKGTPQQYTAAAGVGRGKLELGRVSEYSEYKFLTP